MTPLVSLAALPAGVLAAALAVTAGYAARLRSRLGSDPATGLANRVGLELRAARVGRGTAAVGLLLMDLDGFKQINDSYGHATGNTVIAAVATRLREVALPGEVPVRLHGDEFVLWLGALPAGSAGRRAARRRADALVTAMTTPIPTVHGPITVTSSVGAAVLPAGEANLPVLLGVADDAMYRAKRTRTDPERGAVYVA